MLIGSNSAPLLVSRSPYMVTVPESSPPRVYIVTPHLVWGPWSLSPDSVWFQDIVPALFSIEVI